MKNGYFRNREKLPNLTISRLGFIESVHDNKWKMQQLSRPKNRLELYSAFRQNPIVLKDQSMINYQRNTQNMFQEYQRSVELFGPRSGPTYCRT